MYILIDTTNVSILLIKSVVGGGGEDEMYKTNFIQRLWRECILIINYIKVNKKYPLEKKYMYK